MIRTLLACAGIGALAFGTTIVETGNETAPQIATPFLSSVNTSPTPNGVWRRTTASDEFQQPVLQAIELDILPPPAPDLRVSALTDIQVHFTGISGALGFYWWIEDQNRGDVCAFGKLDTQGFSEMHFQTPIIFEDGTLKPVLRIGQSINGTPWVLASGENAHWRIAMQGRYVFGN